jgi:hypothetical protein
MEPNLEALYAQSESLDGATAGFLASQLTAESAGFSLTTWFFILMLVLIASLCSSRIIKIGRNGVRHLFLKITFRSGDNSYSGYVRSLTPNGLTIVTCVPLIKGQRINVDLHSLPDFPVTDMSSEGVVRAWRKINATSTEREIEIQLKMDSDIRQSVLSYLQKLVS